MKIYEVDFAGVKDGALISVYKNLPAVVVGEDGRGRELGALFVKGAKPKERVFGGELTYVKGFPVLMVKKNAADDEESGVIVVARTKMGFRGHGYLHGRYLGWRLQYDYIGRELSDELYQTSEAAEEAAIEKRKSGIYVKKTVPVFEEYEPDIIARGQVADGMAGNMGSAEQFIFVAKEGDLFSLYRTGRLYGGEPIVQFKVSHGHVLREELLPSELQDFLLGE